MTPDELVGEVSKLASMPDIALRINDLLNDENSSAWDIGKLIEQDPGLSAALLRIANSALYNIGIPVTAIDRAVTAVGTREVRDLAFGVCAVAAFDGISNAVITMRDFWYHSLRTAVAARELGSRMPGRGKGSLFIAGLLHDIGQLVMFSRRPRESQLALEQSIDNDDGRTTYLAERDVFGFDHTDVGTALAREWGLPGYLEHAIGAHHEPDKSPPDTEEEFVRVATVVHVANTIAVLSEIDSETLDDGPAIVPTALDTLGLTQADLVAVSEGLDAQVAELLQVFVIPQAA